jgi:hypothetical protein
VIGSIASKRDQTVDIGFCSRFEMVGQILLPGSDRNQELPKGIEQLSFDLPKYPLSVAVCRIRVDNDMCSDLFLRILQLLLKSFLPLRTYSLAH